MATTTNRQSTIDQLLAIRSTAHSDLVGAMGQQRDSEWTTDRIRDIEYANRELIRLGAIGV